MKKRSSLAAKFIIGFLIMGIAICAVTTSRGYSQYKSYIEKKYNDVAYDIAEIFESYMTEEEIALYMEMAEGYYEGVVTDEQLEEIKSSSEYRNVELLLHSLRAATEANDIFMVYTNPEMILSYEEADAENWKPLTYVFDCYMVEELKFDLGHRGGFNPEFIRDIAEVMKTGKMVNNYFISESDFGYNTSAVYPVIVDGVAKGIICVEIPMATLESALHEYIVNAVAATITIVVVLIAVFMGYMYRNMISPIHMIAEEAEKFVENNAEISEKLDSVKTKDEIQKLSESVLKMEIGIKEYIANITKITAEKERIGAELNVAKQIQADLLPSIFPAFPGRKEFDIFASMDPAKEVGGDFYDFFMVDEDHLVFLIADVSGKGVPAALFMVIAKTLIKNQVLKGEEPSAVFEAVNNQLCENNKEGMFVTAWMGMLEVSTGNLIYVNAGHNPPLIKGEDGIFRYLECNPCFILAGMEGIPYQQENIQLKTGDSIYLYTDGVTDTINLKEEMYGEDRLEAVLNVHKEEAPEEILTAIKKELETFAGEAEQFDDVTMLGFKYIG